jgi:hypothetical protein
MIHTLNRINGNVYAFQYLNFLLVESIDACNRFKENALFFEKVALITFNLFARYCLVLEINTLLEINDKRKLIQYKYLN